jgi:hypothetical protein
VVFFLAGIVAVVEGLGMLEKFHLGVLIYVRRRVDGRCDVDGEHLTFGEISKGFCRAAS